MSVEPSTHVPVACLRALALVRTTEGLTDRAKLAQLQDTFRAVAPSCRLPDACKEALTQGAKLIFETQLTRAEALAIVRQFRSAEAGCR